MSGKSSTLPKSVTMKTRKKQVEPQISTPSTGHVISAPKVAGQSLVQQLQGTKRNIDIFADSLVQREDRDLQQALSQLLALLDQMMSRQMRNCFPLDLLKQDESLGVAKERYEKDMYSALANLVKWVDLQTVPGGQQQTLEQVRLEKKKFIDSLDNLIKLVQDNEANISHFNSSGTSAAMGSPKLPRSQFNTLPTRPSRRVGGEDSDKPMNTLPNLKVRNASVQWEMTPTVVLNKPRRSSQADINVSGIRASASADDLDRNLTHTPDGIGNLIQEKRQSFRDSGIEQSPRSSTSGVPSNQGSPPHSISQASSNELITNGTNSTDGGNNVVPPPLPTKKKHKQKQPEMLESPNIPPNLPPKQRTSKHYPENPLEQSCPPSFFHEPTSPPPISAHQDAHMKAHYSGGTFDALDPMASQLWKRKESVAAIQRINEYNASMFQGSNDPEAPPPIPPKRKHIQIYQGLLGMGDVYEAPQELMRPMIVTDQPPPLPRKRRSKSSMKSFHRQTTVIESSPDLKDSSVRRQSSTTGSDDEASNLLELEDITEHLLFNKEEEGYSLRGGTVDALVAYAASPSNEDKLYTEAFLLIYPTFISMEDLLTKIVQRLRVFFTESKESMWQCCASLLIRLLKNHRPQISSESQSKVIECIHLLLGGGQLKFGQLLRGSLVKTRGTPDKSPPLSVISLSGNNTTKRKSKKSSFLEFKPDALAQQMTLLDSEVFQKVEISEMLLWAKEQNEDKSPTLTQFTEHFNYVSQWTKTQILEKSLDKKGREKVMLHFVAVMKCLREYNNFNSFLCILSAIESASVSRLEWSDKVNRGLEEHRALIDNRSSFKNYRDAFSQAKPPCIPYIGLYLQDLTFINFADDKLEDGVSINFTKRWRQYNAVDKIRLAQTKVYTFEPDNHILEYFAGFQDHKSDDELYNLSLQIKPRGGG